MSEADPTIFSPEDAKGFEKHLQKHGLGGVDVYLGDKLTSWMDSDVSIGIIGESGSGKSAFINTIRGLTADDEGGAPVGTGDTTLEPIRYTHPTNSKISLWDLPGVGTPIFPRGDAYLKMVNFNRIDFFVLMSDTRFTSDDAWLAEQIFAASKNLFFVRTKIDLDFESPDSRGQTEEEVIERVKNYIKEGMLASQKDVKIFCISCFEPTMCDFDDLLNDILYSLPGVKRDALILSLGALSKSVVARKKQSLKNRIWKVALRAAISASVASTGVDLFGDKAVLQDEIKLYIRVFGLDVTSLQKFTEKTQPEQDKLRSKIKDASNTCRQLSNNFAGPLMNYLLTTPQGKLAKVVAIPAVTVVLSSVASFSLCYSFLSDKLWELETMWNETFDETVMNTWANN